MKKLGQEIEDEQFGQEEQTHDFSEDYQNRKQSLLSLIETKKENKVIFHNGGMKKFLQAAAAVILVVGISFTAYAMTKNRKAIRVEIKEGIQTILIKVERKKECTDVIAVPGYLPEGYEIWDEEKEKYSLGKYSFGGVWGANGITIQVNDWMEKEKITKEKITLGEKIEYPDYAKGCSLQVTDITFSEVEDEVHKIDGPVKKLEVAVKLQNTTDKLWEELPVYPVFYSPLMENEPPYDLKGGVPDSKYNGKYYVRLEPYAEKEVYFTFIVSEEGLEEGYLEFFGKDDLKLFK